jgi:alkylation response protein AidB-like acyl-CoA dehydrogenase
MLRGDDVWVQAWSETEAGSDLASLRSTAVRDGDGWRLSGAKIWSSRAAVGDKGFGLFRTGTREERHRGLTYFLFDLDGQGVEVRPIERWDGMPVFAEITFDEAFVPDEDVLGDPGSGWKVAMSTAGSERGLTYRCPGPFMATAAELTSAAIANGVAPESALGKRVAKGFADAEAYRMFTQAMATRVAAGDGIGAEASISKLFSCEFDVQMHDAARELLGPRSMLTVDASEAAGNGRWLEGFLAAQSATIWGGSSEIQRDIVAERLLGLPRSRA